MTCFEYNMRTILIFAIAVIGVLWCGLSLIKILKVSKAKVICIVIIVALIGVFIISCLLSLSYGKDISVKGKIVDITCTGSLGGFLDQYTIYVVLENGECVQYSTPLLSSSKFKDDVATLKCDDYIEIWSNNWWNIMYNFKKCAHCKMKLQ